MAVLNGWKTFFKRSYGIATSIFSIVSILAIFFDVRHIFASTFCIWSFIAIVIIFSCIIAGIWMFVFDRSATIKLGDKKVTLKYGNIFKSKGPIKVIAVNRCFDTLVDNKVIAASSLHGQFINRYFKNRLDDLERIISSALISVPSIDVSAEKHEGKQKRYPPGTVVPVTLSDGSIYYLLALTEMDSTLRAHCQPRDYFIALDALIDYCDQHANGRSVQLPLIGSGAFSRIPATKQDILSAILSVFALKRSNITTDFSIIIGKRDKHSVSINRT